MLLASLDQQEELLKKTTYLLSDQLKEVIYNHQWLIHEKELMISYYLPDIYINGDPSLLYNVWENLLTNAIKYNQANGSIDISIIDGKKDIEIRFHDSGIELSEETKVSVFDRFYREYSARTTSIEGTGLGLSIVSSVITLHKGYIKVESKKNEGSTFAVYLPKG